MLGKMNRMPEDRIRTHYDPKPIPLRQFDWAAWDDKYGADTCAGYGATEQEAIEDLCVCLESRELLDTSP